MAPADISIFQHRKVIIDDIKRRHGNEKKSEAHARDGL